MPQLRRLSRRAGTRIGAVVAFGLLSLVLAACGSEEPPPTNPFDDGRTPATLAPGVATGTPPPLGTPAPSPTPEPSPGAPDGPSSAVPDGGAPGPIEDREFAVARAIELVGEWTGMPATDLQVTSIEAVEWSDACLGVHRPDIACADVLTPGVRVVLQTLLGATTHVVHASETGRYLWAHDHEVEGELIEVDPAASTVRVRAPDGEEAWLIVPGSDIDYPIAALQPGMRVLAGLATIPDGDAIVWLVVVG
jgi:hypothetical protein